MTKLSICIPLDAGAQDVFPLLTSLLENPLADIEIVLAKPSALQPSAEVSGLAAADARLKIRDAEDGISRQLLWYRALEATSGDWATLIKPGDVLERDLPIMLSFLETSSPGVDALAWNAFQIDGQAVPGKAASVAIPASYQVETLDKTAMLKTFFYWEGSLNSPKMPFGLYHAAIRRSLIDALLQMPKPQDWSTPVPQYEWAAKVLLFANDLAFSPRPMSAIGTVPYIAEPPLHPWNFPFHSGLGLAGAVAEVQFHVLRELQSEWTGAGEAFVRAVMIDCMMEKTRENYVAKGNAYYAALTVFDGGRLAPFFRPEFHDTRPVDSRRGLHDGALLVDRFLGGAQTPLEFFKIARHMMAPVGLMCGGTLRDADGKAA
ncbi:hypothetical protein [Pararhizobium gei]|uniref:hypothetical protein n=1 Tax=Pararhizobium gei TaxID=1395951 RepID=UPI0023DC50BB|nr:hypothetical protein [Rhizobium gei]